MYVSYCNRLLWRLEVLAAIAAAQATVFEPGSEGSEGVESDVEELEDPSAEEDPGP